jgi:hypothetical protein
MRKTTPTKTTTSTKAKAKTTGATPQRPATRKAQDHIRHNIAKMARGTTGAGKTCNPADWPPLLTAYATLVGNDRAMMDAMSMCSDNTEDHGFMRMNCNMILPDGVTLGRKIRDDEKPKIKGWIESTAKTMSPVSATFATAVVMADEVKAVGGKVDDVGEDVKTLSGNVKAISGLLERALGLGFRVTEHGVEEEKAEIGLVYFTHDTTELKRVTASMVEKFPTKVRLYLARPPKELSDDGDFRLSGWGNSITDKALLEGNTTEAHRLLEEVTKSHKSVMVSGYRSGYKFALHVMATLPEDSEAKGAHTWEFKLDDVEEGVAGRGQLTTVQVSRDEARAQIPTAPSPPTTSHLHATFDVRKPEEFADEQDRHTIRAISGGVQGKIVSGPTLMSNGEDNYTISTSTENDEYDISISWYAYEIIFDGTTVPEKYSHNFVEAAFDGGFWKKFQNKQAPAKRNDANSTAQRKKPKLQSGATSASTPTA